MSNHRNKLAVQRVLAQQDWSRQFLESLAGLLFSLEPYAEYIPKWILERINRALSEVLGEAPTKEASPLAGVIVSTAAHKALKASRKPRGHSPDLEVLLLLMEPFLTVLDLAEPLIEKLFGKEAMSEVDQKMWELSRLYRRGPVRLRD
jgi:hypothetical protein